MAIFWFLIISSCLYNGLVTGSNDLDVVIIGAGASGIAAATRLLKNNFTNFLVLEGSDRTGGRVNTVKFAGSTIDLGGEWVHGKTGNPSFELAAPLGLLYTQNTYSGDIIYVESCGMPVNSDLVNIATEIIDILSAPNAEFNAIVGNATFAGSKSVGDFVLKLYWTKTNLLIESGKVTQRQANEFLVNLEKQINSFDGSPSWLQTSLHADYQFVDDVQESWITWKGGYGYSTVLELLTEALPNPSKKLPIDERILLNKEVVKVDYSGPKVIVSTADGNNYTAKLVISTVSVAVLKKRAASLFVPNLPSNKIGAIKSWGISVVDKICLEFPYHWLPSGVLGLNMVWHTEDKVSVSDKYKWTTDVHGFYRSDRLPLTVLCGWVEGTAAEAMEAATDEEVIEQSMILLRRFAPNKTEVPSPIALRRSQWGSNRFIGGSYSFKHVESDATNLGPADLAAPVNNSEGKPVLLFAGESTSSEHYGTVHGAIKSGWREADRVLSSSQ